MKVTRNARRTGGLKRMNFMEQTECEQRSLGVEEKGRDWKSVLSSGSKYQRPERALGAA